MTVYYISADRPVGRRLLPPVAFEAAAFHTFDDAINGQLVQLTGTACKRGVAHRRPASTAWRFRRLRRGRRDASEDST